MQTRELTDEMVHTYVDAVIETHTAVRPCEFRKTTEVTWEREGDHVRIICTLKDEFTQDPRFGTQVPKENSIFIPVEQVFELVDILLAS